MEVAYSTNTPSQLDGPRIDKLINQGMALFAEAGIYVSAPRMSKMVRQTVKRFGYGAVEWVIREYLRSAQGAEWESYFRALNGRSFLAVSR